MTEEGKSPTIADGKQNILKWASTLLTWPTFSILALLILSRPIYEAADSLSKLVPKTESFSVGNLQFKLGESLKDLESKAGPDVKDVLSGMQQEDIEWILENNLENSATYSGDVDESVRKWQRPIRLGLVVKMSQAELVNADVNNHDPRGTALFGVAPTAKYDKVRKFLLSSVSEIVSPNVGGAP